MPTSEAGATVDGRGARGGRAVVLALAAIGAVVVHAAAVAGLLESHGIGRRCIRTATSCRSSRPIWPGTPATPSPPRPGSRPQSPAASASPSGRSSSSPVTLAACRSCSVALIVGLVAALLLVEGWPRTRALWAPLAYLWLLVPVWDAFTEPMHEPFQQASAAMGVALLHLTGIPALRDGTFISMPNLQIEVARACSGINYLVAVLAPRPAAGLYLPHHLRAASCSSPRR